MTDKQIIIDEIDVSGCEYCGYENLCKLKSASNYVVDCQDNPNCYYKQLKRKEQECEGLKEAQKNSRCAWKSFEGTFCPEAQEQLDQLKAENDELKKKCNIYTCGICGNKEDCNKLYKTLTEIKEITERDKEFCIKCNGDKEIDCIDCIEGGRALLAKEILQKISEVEE